MIDIEKLRTLVAIVKAQSFARAAEELNLSQPAVSRNIQVLERQFGVRLLDRGRAGVRLTVVGKQVLDRAVDVLASVRSIERTLSAASEGLGGTVRLGIGPFTAATLLPKVLARLAAADLPVSIDVTIDSTSAMTQKLLADEMEFFIGIPPADPGDRFHCEAVSEITSRFFVRPGHPLAATTPTLSAIYDFPIAAGTDLRAALDLSRRDDGREPTTYLVDNLHVLTEITLSTDAVLVAGHAALSNQLVELQMSRQEPPLPTLLSIVAVRNRTPSPASERVRAELTSEARNIYGRRGPRSPGPTSLGDASFD